ncbi:MAG TPA: GNAT family N-acetyltransferase [Tahibacter sp.]|uniref:GNAT family N-acetyltransferase n=1 Tax=Tahibacter sp. TaxID=2056211 RepID=UPI002BFB3817|nr:GNAT family N-acetyltransferase [Tahibacter sp.]HSX60586.1 GNAT family N-acetyltransferase [Tahibacter sp.]
MPPSPDFRLRRAETADLDALVALETASFDYDRMSARQLRRHLDSRSAALLIAEDAQGLLGSALVFYRARSPFARLYSLATAAAARGRGIGGALLAAAESHARERGCRGLRLEVRQDNAAAVQLYETRGYRRTAALADYYDDGAAAWRYEKDLRDGLP